MQENIQDAESTIRDTDVAAEMMKYTKNSILVQSAQAMLAQANQQPQGVLQLLQ
jgi:flagellin